MDRNEKNAVSHSSSVALLEQLREVWPYLTPTERVQIELTLSMPSPPSLALFVERTTTLHLDPWQHHLCSVLESLAWTRGRRILVHGPPQAGKSIVVSQRFPAYLLGINPLRRIRLACYNVSRAGRFTDINRQIIRDPVYQEMFPNTRLSPIKDTETEWNTTARAALNESQASMLALGLISGFVGSGAEDLIIDDPYASPQAAESEAINESTWQFWDEGARVRLNDDTNVIVMFHRYGGKDFAGRLIAQGGLKHEGGQWEYIRYCAEYDGIDKDEEGGYTLPPDPLGRKIGERLSPRMSDAYIEAQKAITLVWLSQFQGTPTSKAGNLFKPGNLRIESALPQKPLWRKVRAWDIAASEDKGDYTAGVKVGAEAKKGPWWCLDVNRFRKGPDETDAEILQTAMADGKETTIRLRQDPGGAGKRDVAHLVRLLHGYDVVVETYSKTEGGKALRARGLASQVNQGNWHVLQGSEWLPALIAEMRPFPRSINDDQIDAWSDADDEVQKDKGWANDPEALAKIRAALQAGA